jgi:radical SAM superfamily enzyme YgiQ (UPF0313 family)
MKSVLFVQLPPPRFSFKEAPTNIPLAAGFLMSALRATERNQFTVEALHPDVTDVFAEQGLLAAILEKEPAAVCFTLYVWNVEKSLFLASNIKKRLPHVFIVMGGPEVTPDNQWVLEHPAVDAGVFGEGESRVGALLGALGEARNLGEPSLCREDFAGFQSLRAFPGIFFKHEGRIHLNLDPAPPWDLAACSYPYLNSAISPSRDGTLFLETVRGCPFRCRYCYYHKTFAGLRFHPPAAVEQALDFAYSLDSRVTELYLMDPTFNARKGFRKILKSMADRRSRKDIALHTELRADLLKPDDVRLLADAGLKGAEIGLQSVNPEALRAAGRTGDPEKIAAGVSLLKQAGIDVTTGIILGLPKDTPQEFRRTLKWLKDSDAYSVVHPFVLSVLPGTDFRASAIKLGIVYDPRPPYHVLSTPTFPEKEFGPALEECEAMFDMELDHIPPPSLVDRGVEVVSSPDQARYISKWIVDPGKPGALSLLRHVIPKATDPFTMWFRGAYDERTLLELLRKYADANPHAVLHVVLEFDELPRPDSLCEALEAAAQPDLFLNRSYRPLHGESTVVSVNFWVILPDPGSRRHRRELSARYEPTASVVWDTADTREERLAEMELPLLISWSVEDAQIHSPALINMMASVFGDHAEDVLFRDRGLAREWTARTGKQGLEGKLTESILFSCGRQY